MSTIVTVNKWGKSLGLRIPKNIAQKLGIEVGAKMDIQQTTDGALKMIPTKPLVTTAWIMEGITSVNQHPLLLDDTSIGQERWWE